ncbi:hypothetical protein CANTEDRAFT_104120 [Yamadazyma tenuis ATCC 10573]|uniref:Uncharacterized protein n=1 Tax=Candida tenuis (strain ATCC 10573 / BCRC 21748 / CBS 615 / JCM 9827 / NBRC 10315 / NRRL Y-1498 / VKM Y-70) TaxID=590646 RepID=G3B1C4_CANTC|nr:uncharacterized protein CANTEDRAFT_104120 [Yamadazyma tenuis ATCC 10573]EGV64938.1 hypothetical protein CANTEDRAFT_104120 [Yamadazyma tenuis ATCC 10573]
MPDLFDNFFTKINMAVNGKSNQHYGGASQVNTGSFYNYHSTPTNNNYWMPTGARIKESMEQPNIEDIAGAPKMERNSSVSSEDSMARSRNNSVVE